MKVVALVVDVVVLVEDVVTLVVVVVGLLVVGALVGAAVGTLVVESSEQEICSFCNAMQIMPVVIAGQLNE